MIDFHSHVIPYIDDGAKNIDEAIKMLEILKAQGVTTVVATPHYYDSMMDIESFLASRDDSYTKLMQKIEQDNIQVPEIILGAEVYLTYEVIYSSFIDKLCIGKTRCILIEIPQGVWFDWVYDLADYLITKKNIRPVIAHFERYAIAYNDFERFNSINEKGIKVQVNADSFIDDSMRKVVQKLVESDIVHVIGSDTHNTSYRKPRILEAKEKIEKKFGKDKWDELQSNAKQLLST